MYARYAKFRYFYVKTHKTLNDKTCFSLEVEWSDKLRMDTDYTSTIILILNVFVFNFSWNFQSIYNCLKKKSQYKNHEHDSDVG